MLPVAFPLLGDTRVRDTYNASRGGGTRVHQGVDLPLLARAYDRNAVYPVRSTVPGTIVRISREGPRGRPNEGNAVFVRDPDGWTHLFAHLEQAPPESMVGQPVQAGTVIGVASNSGNARNTGPHLHYHIVDAHGQRVNPTRRLAELHASFEAQRLATSARRRAMQEREVSTVLRAADHAMTEMQGVGERPMRSDVAPGSASRGVDAHAFAQTTLPVTDDVPSIEDDIPTPPRARTRTLATSGPRAPTVTQTTRALVRRRETQEAIEQARMGYRGARGLVEREAVAATAPSAWDALLALIDREEEERIIASRTLLAPIIWRHLESAAQAAAEAQAGEPRRWIDAYEVLLAAHRLVGTLATPFEHLRTYTAFRPLLTAIRLADQAINGQLERFEALRAAMLEAGDDASEAAPWAFGFGGVAFAVGGLYLIWRGSR
jgi:hypothetical protein